MRRGTTPTLTLTVDAELVGGCCDVRQLDQHEHDHDGQAPVNLGALLNHVFLNKQRWQG